MPAKAAIIIGGLLLLTRRMKSRRVGNKFIIADGSGRALVETGREAEGGRLVKPNETVTVQGPPVSLRCRSKASE